MRWNPASYPLLQQCLHPSLLASLLSFVIDLASHPQQCATEASKCIQTRLASETKRQQGQGIIRFVAPFSSARESWCFGFRRKIELLLLLNFYSLPIQPQPKQSVVRGRILFTLCSADCKRHQFHRISERSMAQVIVWGWWLSGNLAGSTEARKSMFRECIEAPTVVGLVRESLTC